jgi:hypothetical protein
MPGGLDAPQQARLGAGGEHAVDGLEGQRAVLLPHARAYLLGGGVRVHGQPRQHELARHGHAKPSRTQLPDHGVVKMVHGQATLPHFLE